MQDILTATQTFMERAGQLDEVGFPRDVTDRLRVLRRMLLAEEIDEYYLAEYEDNDLAEVIDGLLDIIVVAWGTVLAYVGPDKARRAAAEVARSNLAKVLGEGLPIKDENGKVCKPPDWTPPDIAGAIA